jgi:hypothetical protein
MVKSTEETDIALPIPAQAGEKIALNKKSSLKTV